MKLLGFKAISQGRKLLYLAVLIALEITLVVHLWGQQNRVPFGFLVKNGDVYVLIWKNDAHEYQTSIYPNLNEAMTYAINELNLQVGHNPLMEDELERLWVQDRQGVTVMFWKTSKLEYLNQMTFHRRAEADYYMKAFRTGSYTPSPFGHSIFLRPASIE